MLTACATNLAVAVHRRVVCCTRSMSADRLLVSSCASTAVPLFTLYLFVCLFRKINCVLVTGCGTTHSLSHLSVDLYSYTSIG